MRRVLIAGGGTGGHIYPAVAVAQALRRRDPSCEIHFIGAKKGLETKIIPREGYPLHLLNVGALNQVSLKTKIISTLLLPLAILRAAGFILKVKPAAVLGVGGYASGPAMIAAILLRRPTYLFEPNAHPGLTNRWLARFVLKAFVNFEVSRRYFKVSEIVGIPIREGLSPAYSKNLARKGFNILVFGGSQGARGINTVVFEAVKQATQDKLNWFTQVNLVHQIGSTDFAKMKAGYEKIGSTQVTVAEFLFDMPEQYKNADLVVCRAGASTLAELAALRKAAVLVPLPTASDDHQRSNAEALGARGAAVVILQKDFTPAKFSQVVDDFKLHREKLEILESRVGDFYREGAANKIAADLERHL